MKGLRKMAALLLSLGLCLGLLAGCGDDVFVAKLALTGAAGTFDPQFAENKNSILVASNVFEGLLVEDPEGGLHLGVAKGYTVSPDGRTYTFQLREDACWSDGSAVTAGTSSLPSAGCSGRAVFRPMPKTCARCRMPRLSLPGSCRRNRWGFGQRTTTPWC